MAYYFERALFVVGEQNSGKSTQLRSIFCDVRFGGGGKVPSATKLPDIYRLSNERSLHLRTTSPHEQGENLSDFLDRTEKKFRSHTPHDGRRWSFAGALQPFAHKKMPDLVKTCDGFATRFNPERIRVLFLSPDRHGIDLVHLHLPLVAGLRSVRGIEFLWIDARNRTTNGLLLADYFDFT